VPLKQFRKGEVHLAFYENFCVDPQAEIRRMMAFLNTPFDERALENLGRASSVSRKDSPIRTGGSLLEGWREHVTCRQIERSLEILALFGLDSIYSQGLLPNVDEAYRLLRED
jgi:hypothetical protein